ncbi:MAG: ABC-three component system protein [Candidatus Hydrogenedentes bacterium]|nr:ABC-three component system protein [Candidatus Hydrogenedentota bacterium]
MITTHDAQFIYQMMFDQYFYLKKGQEFERFFCDLLSHVYGDDFEPKPAWGKLGDAKCDGFLRSSGTIFACHAPANWSVSTASRKVKEDFSGAKLHWADKMKEWIYVNNLRDGLQKDLKELIVKLNEDEKSIAVSEWGYHKLQQQFGQLGTDKMSLLFGRPWVRADMLDIEFKDIRQVLEVIGQIQSQSQAIIRAVRSDKLRINGLSEHVADFLKLGMTKAAMVGEYLARHPDAQYGDRLASALRKKYESLASDESVPDQVFVHLQEYLLGSVERTPRSQSSVLAVLAHFFETCDIYREPHKICKSS